MGVGVGVGVWVWVCMMCGCGCGCGCGCVGVGVHDVCVCVCVCGCVGVVQMHIKVHTYFSKVHKHMFSSLSVDMLMQTGERKLVMLTWPTSRSPVKPHSHSPIVKVCL